jgi:hypothetical protein
LCRVDYQSAARFLQQAVLGDRLWGMYDSFPELIKYGVVDVYALRRDQNRPGGFTGAGTLAINTFGGRATAPRHSD